MLRRWVEEEGGDLRSTSYADWARGLSDRPSPDTIYQRFGSWHDAVVAAGYAPLLRPRRVADRAARRIGASE